MPNHYLTVGLCAWDWTAVEAKGLEDTEDVDLTPLVGANLCEVVHPLPDELQDIVSANPPCRYRHKETGEWWPGNNGPEFASRNEFEQVPLSDAEKADLTARLGAVTWYEWCRENWGTKWGTYDLKVHQMGGDGSPVLIEFQTAWGPPSPEIMRKIERHLHDSYCLHNITWTGHDPGSGQTEAVEVASELPA